MRNRALRRRVRRGLLLAASLAVLAPASAPAQQQPRAEDARPPTAPPGFEPVDVEPEVQRHQQERAEKLRQQAEIDRYYRTNAPLQRIRARYGSATWDLYDPYE